MIAGVWGLPERAMHARLLEWGACLLKGSITSDKAIENESDSGRRPQWTGAQIEAARAMHNAVIALPEVRLMILLQVFYRCGEARTWDELPVVRRRRLEFELARETNARIGPASRERGMSPVYVHGSDLTRQRDRGIAMLIAAEREAKGERAVPAPPPAPRARTRANA